MTVKHEFSQGVKRISGMILTAFALGGNLAALQPAAAAAQLDEAALAAWIDEARAWWGAPGLAVGVVIDGELAWTYGSGVLRKGSDAAATPRSIFAIGSATKSFTGALAGDLAARGLLDLDGLATAQHPGLKFHDAARDGAVTLAHMLSHQTGLPPNNLMFWNADISTQTLIERVRYLEPVADVGERYAYQNLMFMMAGEISARAGGASSWAELAEDRLFRPLGMRDTTAALPDRRRNVAAAHARYEDGWREINLLDLRNIAPAGAVHSSVNDMARWVEMLLAGGEWRGRRVMREAAIRDMWTARIELPPDAQERLFAPGATRLEYGLGWFLQDYFGENLIHHAGSTDGMVSTVMLAPERDFGVVVLVNAQAYALPQAVAFRALDDVLGRDPEPISTQFRSVWEQYGPLVRIPAFAPPEPFPVSDDVAERLPGVYVHPLYGAARITRAGGARFEIELLGAPGVLHPRADEAFSIEWAEGYTFKQIFVPQLTFSPGAAAVADQVVLGSVFGPLAFARRGAE